MKRNGFKRIIAAAALLLGSLTAVACNNTAGPTKIDYAHNGSCVMALPYQNIDFFHFTSV